MNLRILRDVPGLTPGEQGLLVLALNRGEGGPEATLDNLGFFTVDHAAARLRSALADHLLGEGRPSLEAMAGSIFGKLERS